MALAELATCEDMNSYRRLIFGVALYFLPIL